VLAHSGTVPVMAAGGAVSPVPFFFRSATGSTPFLPPGWCLVC